MADFLHPSLQRDIKRFCLRYGLNVSHAYHTPTDFWNDEGAGDQAVFVCLLHQMPFGEALKLVRAARQRFRNVLLVDYKLPERNLDFPAYWLGHYCERMGAHYGLYDRFMRHGWRKSATEIPHSRELIEQIRCYGLQLRCGRQTFKDFLKKSRRHTCFL